MPDPAHGFVGRGGLKLEKALTTFGIDPTGLWCADLGCSTGGFTDCLVQHGAGRVFSVDTGYGVLDYKLRTNPRVTTMERTNAVHTDAHADCIERGGADLVVIDLGWTVQRLAIPAALRWLSADGRIISLIKPHYEAKELGLAVPRGGVLEDADAERALARTLECMPGLGVELLGCVESPLRGSGGKGNREWLALLSRSGLPGATRPAPAQETPTATPGAPRGPGRSPR